MTFQYTALSFASPEKVRFRYRLTSIDPEWIEAGGGAPGARYPKLPPGHYEFRVTACNNEGRWNPEGGRIALTVLPPYWQTWWFMAVAAAGSVSAVAGGARYWMFRRLRRRLRLLEQQHALEKERSRIARDMHDEIGARLTQISFLCELVKRDLDHPAEARKDLDRMSGAAREVIKGLEEIVWTVNPKHDSLDDLATYLTRYAQEVFQGSAIACTLDIPLHLPAMPLSADVRHNLFLAVKEALNNIVKHAAASAVKIQLRVGPGAYAITITDNGRGFHRSTPRSPDGDGAAREPAAGDGLANMRERLEASGGRCRIESHPQRGTTVVLEMPHP